MINNKSVLLTGGTGSFGQKFVEIALTQYRPRRLIIFSRDEHKQQRMQEKFSPENYPCLRYFIGDIRDKERLQRAFSNIDIVIHAAALRTIPSCEYNPYEAVKTNILGTQNIIEAAINEKISKLITISTDKAANPMNLYGATKLCADKLFINGNNYAGLNGPRFSVARYGNVLASRGNIIEYFLKSKKTGKIDITDPNMTRFWITLEQSIDFVLNSLEVMQGGEIFIPKIPSMSIGDIAKALCPECEINIQGIRPGEKMHEIMIPMNEAVNTYEFENYFVQQPAYRFFERTKMTSNGVKVPPNFEYSSDTNTQWLNKEDLLKLINTK
ncbi:UDP-N-acetylglucosamine 4,6-dehydratase (inverting) [Desulfovibrio sp. UCD-KL4C]|uniref:UDP-N-acetylglucosamine 4,6-dehydratase (inverting) n=1 Tax=Desulfovibrio sp. UCD-KL4C TaxID=2578120 RepID=UPI0025BDDA1A|nr:UDP-N-acetylglucosamine 4,6-dehydratase (inverting) [Desulfovibrio sp. UCD-KL4C]